jgi:hypothetical protein
MNYIKAIFDLKNCIFIEYIEDILKKLKIIKNKNLVIKYRNNFYCK